MEIEEKMCPFTGNNCMVTYCGKFASCMGEQIQAMSNMEMNVEARELEVWVRGMLEGE